MSSPGDILKAMHDKLEVLECEEVELEKKLSDTRDTITKARESISQLEAVVASIASQWGISSNGRTTEHKTTQPVKKQSKSVKKKAEPVKAEPVKAEPVKAEPVKAEPVKAEPVKAEPVKEDAEEDEEVLEIEQDGVKYVVFLDTNEVAEADDEEETIVGKWDSSNKTVLLDV